jgi:hypothetical protein
MKYRVFMIDTSGEKVGDALTKPMDFAAAAAFCRGWIAMMDSFEVRCEAIPFPLVVIDEPPQPDRPQYMIRPEINFAPCQPQPQQDQPQIIDLTRANEELCEVAESIEPVCYETI